MTTMRHRRRRCGLSLDDLAKKARISKSFLSLVERGLFNAGPASAKRIDAALDAGGALAFEFDLLRSPKSVRDEYRRLWEIVQWHDRL